MSISLQELQRRLDNAMKSKVISAKESFIFNLKFRGGNEKLTPRQEELYKKLIDDKSNLADSKGIDISKWNKRMEEAFKAGKLSREDRFELSKKLRGEYRTLTEAEAEEMFRKVTEGKISSAPGTPPREAAEWQNEVRRLFLIDNGMLCEELLRKIKSGAIQTKDQFDKLIQNARDVQKINKNKIEELKNILNLKIKEAITILDRKCQYIIPKIFFDELEEGINKFELYRKRTGITDIFNQGKDIDKVIDEIKEIYDKEIKLISECVLKEEEASDILYKMIEKLKKVDTDESKKFVDRLEKILNEQGPIAAAALVPEGLKECQTAVERDRRRLISDLSRAQKAADNDKEVIAFSLDGYTKINTMFGGSTYPLFKKWLAKGSKEIYKVSMDELLKNIPGKESIIKKKCENATTVIFKDKNDFDACCKAPNRRVFYMARDLFKFNESSSNQNQRVAAVKDQAKEIEDVRRSFMREINQLNLRRLPKSAPGA